MTSKEKIDLYIANNLEELNQRADNNPSTDKAKSANCAQITNVIETTWAEAKKAEQNRDEERAYILYMRLYTCFTLLKKAKDVTTNRSTVEYYQKGAIIWLEKAKELSDSLKERYDAKNAAKLEEERRIQAEIDEENSLQKSISPKVLYKYVNEKKKNILLIDMRLKSDYDQSHMRTSACIHIPADLMNKSGWTTWGVESTLKDEDALKKFKQRSTFDYIVLFDDDSYENNLKSGSPIMGLKQAMFSLDRDVQLKREPLILDGGYNDWMIFYPGLSTGPLISKTSNGQLQSFEVSYPEDEIIAQEVPSDITTAIQPEAIISIPTDIPQIDRTRKPTNNQKPESSSVIEMQELPVKPVEEEKPTEVKKEQPQIPDRSIKPLTPTGPSSPISQEVEHSPIISNISPSINSVTPIVPKPMDIPEIKNDLNKENVPLKVPIPTRETLSVYRPMNQPVVINNINKQHQKQFDKVTGRKIIHDPKAHELIVNLPENETIKPSAQPIPTINRENKPLLTEQERRQIINDYHGVTNQSQVNGRTGLKNLGNSCYMNSIIQSLSFHSFLTNYFFAGDYKKHINAKNTFGSGGIVAQEWFYLNYLLWSQQYSYVVPQRFKYFVGKLQQTYAGTQQQDAHEFLIFLLDSLHEDLNQATRPRLEELKPENFNNDHQFAEATKKAFRLHNKSIIVDLFYGLFKSTTICRLCSYSSIGFEAFAIISLPIPPIRQCSLNDCLDLFREFELLKGDQAYDCSKCKRLSEKNRRLEIWELPKIFIVHFKRFRLQQNHYIKNETLIRYPTNNVDFSRWSRTTTTAKYSLISVVNHFGSMNSGHYTSYCNDGQQWYYCDDQSIRTADSRELEQNVHAYLLFYSSIPQQQLRLPFIPK